MRSREQVREFYNQFYEREYADVNDVPKPGTQGLPFYWEFLRTYRPLGGRAVEIACGEGKLLRILAPHFEEIVGLDICDVAVERATRYLSDMPHASAVRGSDLGGFQDASLDLVYSITGFQHMPKAVTREYVAAIPAKLKPAGLTFLQVIEDSRYDEIDNEGCEYTSSWPRTEFRELLCAAGLSVVSFNVHDISYLLPQGNTLNAYYVLAGKE